MVQKDWNLNMFFLQDAMQAFGKRNANLLVVINFLIIFLPHPVSFGEGRGEVAHADEELSRLFYVALTRAEQNLFISYCCFKNDGKELEPSMFIAEILDMHELETEKVFIDANTKRSFKCCNLKTKFNRKLKRLKTEYINSLLERFVMNVTALNNYLKCPLEFYFKNLNSHSFTKK